MLLSVLLFVCGWLDTGDDVPANKHESFKRSGLQKYRLHCPAGMWKSSYGLPLPHTADSSSLYDTAGGDVCVCVCVSSILN